MNLNYLGLMLPVRSKLLERAGQWTQKRWGWLSRLLWPGRESVAGQSCWPDVVNQVSELARDATLPKPKWSVIVGKYRSSWPVEMWKRRDEFTLGEPQYTPEDVERIGEDPEVVLASRKHWLRDSETALEWLANKFRNLEQPVAPVVVPAESLLAFTNAELMSELAKVIKTNKEKHWKANELRLKILECNPGRTTSVKSIEKNLVYKTLLETQGRQRKRKIDPDVLHDVVSQSLREHAAENGVRIKGRRIQSRD
jgi:hypothetical protein